MAPVKEVQVAMEVMEALVVDLAEEVKEVEVVMALKEEAAMVEMEIENNKKDFKMNRKFIFTTLFGMTLISTLMACNEDKLSLPGMNRAKDGEHGEDGFEYVNGQDGFHGQNALSGQNGGHGGNGGNSGWGRGGNGGNGGNAE